MFAHIWHWIEVHTGTVNESGPYYGFFSGFGSDIGEIAIVGGVITIVRRHTCHVKGCWRIGKHSVDGTPYIVCSKHHPSTPNRITADHVAEAHDEATTCP